MHRALLLLLLASIAHAQPMPDRTERVFGAAKLWAKTKFFHPYLAYKDIDWDDAFVKALPKIEAATTIEQYRTALGEMLGKLGDPVTRVGASTPPLSSTKGPGSAAITWPTPVVMQVDMAGFVAGGFDSRGFAQRGQEIEAAAAKAKILVVDLRSQEPPWVAAAAISYFDKALPAIEAWPVQRAIEHRGWRTQEGSTSGGYFSAFVTVGAQPAQKPKPTGPQHVVFVADDKSALPVEAIALQGAGRATIVSTGALDPAGTVETTEVELPGDIAATIRMGELVGGPPTADVVVATGDPRARAVALAKKLVDKPPRARAKAKAAELPPLRVRNDLDYAITPFPSRELRVLAAVRVWGTLEHFFPYRYLVEDWDRAFRDMLPKFEAAADRTAYINALREFGARAGDGHIGVFSPTPDPAVKPRATIGASLRLIDNKVVVVRSLDKALAVGDVVEAIDGKPVATLLAEKKSITSGSNIEARDQRIAGSLGLGDDGTTAKLTITDTQNKRRDVEVARSAATSKALTEVPGPAWKMLPNNIGYVNLMKLAAPEIQQMLDELKGARAIVFDIRGYANGSMWQLTPRLNKKRAKYGAQFLKPFVSGIGSGADQRIRFLQEIAQLPKDAPIYPGKVVMLIDDRAISHSEHNCLFFSEAAGATFIGSPTAGANGDITALRLPGGLRMWFTGQEVRWVDGRQLQKLGVQPSITIRPTLAGLRAGKDEVLDRALAFLAQSK